MAITINGNGTITGISVGGLPDGIVDTDMIAANAVATAKIADDAVATAKIADNAVTSAKSSGLGGLTMANTWNCSSGFNYSSNTDITSWSEDTNGKVGTGMTNSSGIFTFPSTGIYRVRFSQSTYNIGAAANRYIGAFIYRSTNGGSSYTLLREQYNHINDDNACTTTVVTSSFIDVTSTSDYKVKFTVAAENNSTLNAGYYGTYVEFLKFGET